ncbi:MULTISPECIES: peptidase domain-containing ABC transporter [unclassified Prochlorococcus]|uniref:peptidase domain-containing ABC transporter n=1 Tax=unclassified Prochlorococcus TaxID=2627481 RepID=UPI000533A2D7|nr:MULTISPECIES: peptidase domain-containing ABC transporter [unclassified Prochlorococcus]KGG27073.1 Toxin secretion ABC transporter ATP-binding protein [Prochlorococcus sp. MIT 0701]KGG27849.1 Toxin secretion ABC transporter ATP-binding protein [Prochlorococcus sp. MIT 0702]KGG31428.1 Toxin secretion ABC transporter ATP-binding protein [Prochlorococcus sp. MIT 0703]
MNASSASAALPNALQSLLNQPSARLQFEPGQPMCSDTQLPSQVFLIVSGEARVLANKHARLQTLFKLKAGDVAGIASLMSVDPCESIIASTQVEAAALSDKQVLALYREDDNFRTWCNTQFWDAELHRLLHLLREGSQSALPPLQGQLNDLLDQATLLDDSQEALGQALREGRRVFLGSANCSEPLGSELTTADDALPELRPPLARRLISLPAEPLNLLLEGEQPALSKAEVVDEANALATAPPSPLASAEAFGQQDPLRDLEVIRADGLLEETLACFQMLSRLLKLPFRRDAVERVVRDALRRGQTPNLQLLGQVAAMLGLHAVGAKISPSVGNRLKTPMLLQWGNGFALAVVSNEQGLTLASPAEGWLQVSTAELEELYPDGLGVVMVERTSTTPDQRFGPSWFFPALRRYRAVLLQVLLASFVVQLFTLANPLLIQVIIDKVINQRSLDTLQVLGIALVGVTIFEGVLGALRTFLFTQTTNRIDMRLGAEVIDHLLRLPLNYFDKRPVGELGTRVAELEKIRQFLTGQALTTVIDAAFSVIYILVMALYSWVLTIVALIVVPIQVLLTVIGAPLFRQQFRQAANENAKTQSHLVEVLTGIQTVKAQNVEMVSRWKWQDLYNGYINRTFEKTVTGTALTQMGQMLQKISQLAVLWVGASMVLSGDLTLGQLIAFRIISGYVTQPLLRLSSIWQNIQELRVSFERLADVVDTPQESNTSDQGKIPLPPVKGDVTFDNLSYRFGGSGQPDVLQHIDVHIPSGTFVGIVGQSGSGKSTLMKLLPRLYQPREGRILIDGYDIDKVELYSLRRQIGIVPQEPLLFAGTVTENIALTDPDASSEMVVNAARLACAHDFVMELPAGYSSNVGERGASLSGGQRQRIALARTLLSNPKLLVLDEATSSLDYETERKVCDNLRNLLYGSTTFFITHRLSTIRRADRILMLHQGAIVESGSHEELMAIRGRYYALYQQQEGG